MFLSSSNSYLPKLYASPLSNKPTWIVCPRDVAAAPQPPQLGGAQANFGGPSYSEIVFWLRDYFQFSRLVYNRFKR